MTNRDKIRIRLIDERNAEIEKLKKQIARLQDRIEELEEDNAIAMARMGKN